MTALKLSLAPLPNQNIRNGTLVTHMHALTIFLYFLKSQGISIPVPAGTKDYSSMTLEELVGAIEHIEDLIAEMEHKMKEQVGE